MYEITIKPPSLILTDAIEALLPFLTIAEAATLPRFKPGTNREIIRKGRLSAVKVGLHGECNY